MDPQAVSRKVAQVAGHDPIRPAFNRRGQDVEAAGVRQIEFGGTCRVACHNGLRKVPLHHRSGSVQPIHRQIRAVGQNTAHPFCVDVRVPLTRSLAHVVTY